ncbi:MAG: nitroreductase, partial [Acetobacteraceae bacterium]|nr:nitroreductase [Acetobacteraceae bacterium]
MNGRTADHPINSLFLNRWSPRAFDGQPMPDADLM